MEWVYDLKTHFVAVAHHNEVCIDLANAIVASFALASIVQKAEKNRVYAVDINDYDINNMSIIALRICIS